MTAKYPFSNLFGTYIITSKLTVYYLVITIFSHIYNVNVHCNMKYYETLLLILIILFSLISISDNAVIHYHHRIIMDFDTLKK